MHYGFLTAGALDRAPGYSRKARLYDVPEGVRAALGEEGIAGAHGAATSSRCASGGCSRGRPTNSPEERRDKLRAMGYDGGHDLLVSISHYGDDPDYVEGFVEGCLERMRKEEADR